MSQNHEAAAVASAFQTVLLPLQLCTNTCVHAPFDARARAHVPTQGLNDGGAARVEGLWSQQDKACEPLAACALSDCMCPLWSRCELGLVHPGPDLPPGSDPHSAPQRSGGPHQELQVRLPPSKRLESGQIGRKR